VSIPIKIRGLEESPVTDITLSDIHIDAKQKCIFENCQRVKLNDVYINGEKITAE
jgi:hypothetical protein